MPSGLCYFLGALVILRREAPKSGCTRRRGRKRRRRKKRHGTSLTDNPQFNEHIERKNNIKKKIHPQHNGHNSHITTGLWNNSQRTYLVVQRSNRRDWLYSQYHCRHYKQIFALFSARVKSSVGDNFCLWKLAVLASSYTTVKARQKTLIHTLRYPCTHFQLVIYLFPKLLAKVMKVVKLQHARFFSGTIETVMTSKPSSRTNETVMTTSTNEHWHRHNQQNLLMGPLKRSWPVSRPAGPMIPSWPRHPINTDTVTTTKAFWWDHWNRYDQVLILMNCVGNVQFWCKHQLNEQKQKVLKRLFLDCRGRERRSKSLNCLSADFDVFQ